jgi:hypothetical protein
MLPFVWFINPLNAELNPVCYLLALLGPHHFLHVSRIRVNMIEALPRLRGLIMCLCFCRPKPLHVGFVVGTVALRQVFLVILWFCGGHSGTATGFSRDSLVLCWAQWHCDRFSLWYFGFPLSLSPPNFRIQSYLNEPK